MTNILFIFLKEAGPWWAQPQDKGKAVSRFLFLNLSFIFATYPLASDGQPSPASIFGFTRSGGVPDGYRYPAS